MTGQEKLQKLALYAVTKKRLAIPIDTIESGLNLHRIRSLNRRLRKELEAAGIDEATLNLDGEILSKVICEHLQKLGGEQ